ncbi:hypothetical protein BC941DRAFT_443033 [Chlamydoabsidia padenii]|nr:hypothetical protein BC941DRAFT_443033 [Chlamydoabsidia padenii]
MIIRPSSSSRSVDLPVHLRYQVADPQLTHRSISVPSPKVGWSCQSQHPPSLLSALHHHSKTPHLTWIPLSSAPHTLLLTVPVGNTKDAAIVQWGTLVMIVLGTAWILHAIGYAIRKHRRHLVKGKRRKSE